MLRIRSLVICLAGLLASVSGAPALAVQQSEAAAFSLLPAAKAPADLPRRAEIGPEQADLLDDMEGEDMSRLGTLAPGTKVFVIGEMGSLAHVLTAAGLYGWVESAWLRNVTGAGNRDFRRIAEAIANPAAQAKLEPAQQQWLQAAFAAGFAGKAWGIQEYGADASAMVRQELAALELVRVRQLELALPVLVRRWESRFFNDNGGVYAFAEHGLDRSLAQSHFLLQDLAPKIDDALGKPDDIDRLFCRRFRKDGSSGWETYTFGGYGADSNIFALSFILRMHRGRPMPDCLLKAAKKIAAANLVEYRRGYRAGDVELAIQLLQKTLGREQLDKWVADLARQEMPHFGGNLAAALIQLKEVDAAPHVARLVAMARQDGEIGSDAEFAARHMALRALWKRAPSRRVQEVTRAILVNAGAEPLLRQDALRLLTQPSISPGVAEALPQVLKEPAGDPPSRVRQMAAEILAGDALRQSFLSTLKDLIDDRDPYVGDVALNAVRNETLRAMKAARTVEARARIRGDYLEMLRRQVESLALQPPELEVKKSPLWMLKPQAKVSIQLRREPDADTAGLPQVRIATPRLGDPTPAGDAPVLDPDSQPRLLEKFAIHPGRALFKYGGSGGKKTMTISLKLDELTIDGEDIVARSRPGIYAVELVSPNGETQLRVAWYCEPDNAFWSEAAFENEGGE